MSESFLPYGRHWIDEDDIAAVAECLRGDWLTTGPAVEAFEAAFAEVVGARYAVVVSNGTVALHLAALAANVGANDVGIAPTMSFLASANGMRYTGAEIVFADADPKTGLITPVTFRAAIARAGKPVKMAVVVHLNGNPVDMLEIAGIAAQHNIVLVEDACHALGTTYRDENGAAVKVGACHHSAMTVFSLHPVKTITMGEGGVVTTSDPALYERLKLLRSHGIVRAPGKFLDKDLAFARAGDANPWYYEMQELGFNYRAPDFACVLAHSQLKKLSMFAERRAQLKQIYDRHFGDVGDLVEPLRIEASVEPVLHLYPLLIDFAALGKERARVMADLRERGVGTQVHYIPIHHQPYYVEQSGAVDLPGADAYYAKALSIPYYPLMTDQDAERVAKTIKSVLGING
ncbi:UDP-4-amino-4,6-dideoxy-N-acetyl-beta-L-altrosamine transaminase [Mesorhizobium amorphae]|uniref:UDP-4-amino-4, 6-dideoxy-N-acetyl-beta-L-altrosamine transaminase n=1 Tax=Mesorhizobium amorphae TaxID=71433 RepID=UPI001181D110|nr:UDP-4-amino-4,6-dideoxy-N-acetyl-beta-L-altrosamine transaminase [Mesorhizobium amorphae]